MIMMRNRLLWAGAAVAILAGVYFFVSRVEPEKENMTAAVPPMVSLRNELPRLSVALGDRTSVPLNELSGDVVLIFFNPECDHCHQQAEKIAAEKSAFDGWQVYFIASTEPSAAEEFGVKYKLTDPNFHFGSASVSEVFEAVGQLNEVPTILIYKNRMFIGRFDGVTPLEELKKKLI